MAIQQDPSKSFGSTSYFQNKDEQRRVVNDMRREQRNKRIAQQGLTRNIKRAIRKGENPNAYIDAAKQMGLDPLGGGGLGPEAAQRDAGLRAKAASLFEEASQLRKKSDSTVNKQGVTTPSGGTVSKQGVATPSGGIASEFPAINSDATNTATTSTSASLPTNMDNGKFSTDLGKKADAYYKKVEANYSLANSPLGESGGNNVTEKAFRTGLFKAMKMAKTVEEINELRRVAERSGIDVGKFNSLVKPSLVDGAPDWAKDVDNDRTFKGEDLTRFAGKTREEAKQIIMSQKAANDMRYFDSIGKANAQKEDNAYNQMVNEVATTEKQQDDINRRTKEALDPANIAKQKTDFAKTQEFPKAFEKFSSWDFQEGVNWIDRFNEKTTASMDQIKERSKTEQFNNTANIMRDAQAQIDAQSQANQTAIEDQQKSIDFNAGMQTNENTRVANMIKSANQDLFNRSTKGKIYNTGSAMVDAVAKATSSIFNNTNPYYIK